jgi:hypothetical protein
VFKAPLVQLDYKDRRVRQERKGLREIKELKVRLAFKAYGAPRALKA